MPTRFAQRAGSLGPSELNSSGSGFAVVAVHGSAASNEGRALTWISPTFRWRDLLRKEVIQPQVPLQLPCYDFTPVTNHTIGGCLPCGLAHRLPVPLASMV